MFAGLHILQRQFAFADLVLTSQRHKGNLLSIGVRHLLFHLGGFREYLSTDAISANLINNRQTINRLLFTKVDEQHLRGADAVFGIEVELVEHIVDTVSTKGDTNARQSRHTEDTRQVVITATAGDAAYLNVKGLHLEDGSRVVVQTTGQREVKLEFIAKPDSLQSIQNEAQFLNTFQTRLAVLQHIGDSGQFLIVAATEHDDGLQLLDLLLGKPIVTQLLVDVVDANLIQFVNGNGDIDNLVGSTNHLGNAGENLAVIDFDLHTDAEA